MARRKEPVVVLGLGRFGTAVARELARGGTEVLGIDSSDEVVQRLAGELGRVVAADTTDLRALEEVGVPDFRRAVVAIGTAQEASILTTALLGDLEIPDIWAKAMNQQHAKILSRVGAHHVVLPESEMGERVAHLVDGGLRDYVELAPDWVLAVTTPPQAYVGVPLGQSRMRARHRVTVVSVRPENATGFGHAGVDTVLAYGDEIVVAGHPRDVEAFVDTR